MDASVFRGCIPALMTPCHEDGTPNFDALVKKGVELTGLGMTGVVYCGSMGDWPLLTDQQRQQGVKALTEAGVPVVAARRSLVREPKTRAWLRNTRHTHSRSVLRG